MMTTFGKFNVLRQVCIPTLSRLLPTIQFLVTAFCPFVVAVNPLPGFRLTLSNFLPHIYSTAFQVTSSRQKRCSWQKLLRPS